MDKEIQEIVKSVYRQGWSNSSFFSFIFKTPHKDALSMKAVNFFNEKIKEDRIRNAYIEILRQENVDYINVGGYENE